MGSGGTQTLWSPGELVCLSIAVVTDKTTNLESRVYLVNRCVLYVAHNSPRQYRYLTILTAWVLYGQASRAISTG